MFRSTPVEEHLCEGHMVFVKREDLCAEAPMPPLAKMRGVQRYLERLKASGAQSVGVMDTKVSKSGLGVAVISEALGLECHYYFPAPQGEEWRTPWRQTAKEHSATLIPLPGGRIAIAYARAKAQEQGVMLPLGFPLFETVCATAEQVPDGAWGTVVVPCGTGTISSGVLLGLAQRGICATVVSVTASMDPRKVGRKAEAHLARSLVEGRSSQDAIREAGRAWQIVKRGEDYYTPEESGAPFPAHPYYEGKAWGWLRENVQALTGPVLFWNAGS